MKKRSPNNKLFSARRAFDCVYSMYKLALQKEAIFIWPLFFNTITNVSCAKQRVLGHACMCPGMNTGQPLLTLYPPPSKLVGFSAAKIMEIPHASGFSDLKLRAKLAFLCSFFGEGGFIITKLAGQYSFWGVYISMPHPRFLTQKTSVILKKRWAKRNFSLGLLPKEKLLFATLLTTST